jgi:hypothetical protein
MHVTSVCEVTTVQSTVDSPIQMSETFTHVGRTFRNITTIMLHFLDQPNQLFHVFYAANFSTTKSFSSSGWVIKSRSFSQSPL